ncbi:MAG: bifunctional (p)ppGpp synthetase/guanosine-3',5'-bis(diphosphate) 3'-pyrophosphohydrolase [Acidobacteria bacterium]|nr:bifunctional (p)ppGpp synthetase/guanosine-3',5'-bis(diphosphate) 3'-pyrophosphohydrolase [Acidobacteriota bacterium]
MNNIWQQEKYLNACKFAAEAHNGQLVPGTDLPYLVHLSLVSMEVIAAIGTDDRYEADLAMQCAWLHDTIEDTKTSYDDIADNFGAEVARGVQALTKDKRLTKTDQMPDSLKWIKTQPKEVWVVKMADRITNLQPPPPKWSQEKIAKYRIEALLIHAELKEANEMLADRLYEKAEAYKAFIKSI